MDPDAKKMLGVASRYSYLGIFFGVAILVGYFAGRWLDRRFHTDPWLSVVGLLVGVASGFRELIQLARQGLREENQGNGAADTKKQDDKQAGKQAPNEKPDGD